MFKPMLRPTFGFSLYSLFAISIVLPILIATMFITSYLNAQNIKATEQQVQNITDQIAKNINTFIYDLENVANTPALYDDIFNTLRSYNRGVFLTDILEQNRLQSNYIATFTKLIYTNSNDIDSVRFFPTNPSNNLVFEVNKSREGLYAIAINNYHENPNFQNAIANNGKMYLTSISEKEINGTNHRIYSALKAIKDFDTKQIIGVLQIDVLSENLEKMIQSIVTSENSFIFLANNESVLYANKEYDTSLEKNILSSSGSFVIDSHSYRTIDANIPHSDWKIIYAISQNDLAAANKPVFILSICISFLTIAVAFFIFKNVSNRLVSDIKSIVSALKKIREGDLTTRITVHRNNDLNMIAHAVNEMTIDLDQHIKQEFIAVVEQKKAENRALQSQINPHFLYNTLNCLLALNRMGERNKLESAIVNLTRLFQYTSVSEKSVSIQTECDFLEKYINLQQIHFEDRLFYTIKMDECCKNIEIPKLILQPLVENCIIHGMGSTDDSMFIEISAAYSDETKMCTIIVKDNGVGFNMDHRKEHIGLTNVKKRLMLWNDTVDFSIASTLHVGTIITIKFCEQEET
ncbi:sensor histidine kinase [Paenibacillus azoreducens]|uniref:sensor histidine kinase n=1 Tax=Paenibacillus azoreducens TaxID=116718 RepID=UPI0039F58E32